MAAADLPHGDEFIRGVRFAVVAWWRGGVVTCQVERRHLRFNVTLSWSRLEEGFQSEISQLDVVALWATLRRLKTLAGRVHIHDLHATMRHLLGSITNSSPIATAAGTSG